MDALEQREAGGLGAVLADGHDAHRNSPAADHGDGEARRSDLHLRADGDEADLALRAHKELALWKPAPQAVPKTARGYRFQVDPVCPDPKRCRMASPREGPESNLPIGLRGESNPKRDEL